MNRPTLLLMLFALLVVACEEKDAIEEAMEEIELQIDTTAISIGDAEPTPEPKKTSAAGGGGSSSTSGTTSASTVPAYSSVTISENDVVDFVNRRKGQVRACYEKELKSDPDLMGTVSVAWTVTAGGGVSGVRVLRNGTGNRDMESCIVRTINGWNFPASHGSAVDIEYPFRFTPGV